MEEKKTCPVCGEITYSYMGHFRKDGLCRKHAQEMKDGKLIKCEKCGEWHHADEKCKDIKKYKELPTSGFEKCIVCGEPTSGYAFCKSCFKKYTPAEMLDILNGERNLGKESTGSESQTVKSEQPTDKKENVSVDFGGKSKCIACGKQTDGFLFCTNCYHKYKNKQLLFRITNCTNVELLDEDYEGRYTCKDGHIVKSKSERDIDNYLFEHGVPHAYERELAYGATEKEVLHPDFYLPNYLGDGKHVYIEHWGYNENNIQYTKTKKFKMPIYEKLGITLVCTYEKTDMGKIETVLDRKLNKAFIKENAINYEE